MPPGYGQRQCTPPCTCTPPPSLTQVSLPGSCTKPGPKTGHGFAAWVAGRAVVAGARVGGLGLVRVCACRLAPAAIICATTIARNKRARGEAILQSMLPSVGDVPHGLRHPRQMRDF